MVMSLMIKVGKKTKQGFTKTLISADMGDCYSYALSALISIEFLKINKSRSTGMDMGYCISALRQVLFAKIKRDPNTKDRLPLGTMFWGDKSTLKKEFLDDERFYKALGNLEELTALWGKNIHN